MVVREQKMMEPLGQYQRWHDNHICSLAVTVCCLCPLSFRKKRKRNSKNRNQGRGRSCRSHLISRVRIFEFFLLLFRFLGQESRKSLSLSMSGNDVTRVKFPSEKSNQHS